MKLRYMSAPASVVLVVLGLLTITTGAGGQSNPPTAAGPDRVESKDDSAVEKLDPALQEQVESGSTREIPVFVTVAGDTAPAEALLKDDNTAKAGGAALVIGRIAVQALPKLAGAKDVVGVGPIDFKQTGKPLGGPDPEVGKRPSKEQTRQALAEIQQDEIPFDQAPPIKGSNFEALKDLAVLDVKTHNFVDAWKKGYTGDGVTVGVLDGGTDFGHPDLIGTWQTWSGQTGVRAGWNGWPKAFDPYGTLQFLSAPSQISQGLSWYTLTSARACPAGTGACQVNFATRTGPSRNFGAPSGTRLHTYSFPRSQSKSGTVRLGSHPDDHLLALYEERPAFLVADPNTAGVYDTVYVDLDNDYSFADEKPVSKQSPASYRDLDGDGYTDLSGGLLHHISDGATPLPGGPDAFGVLQAFAPGQMLAWSGDYDPAIGGHGTLTASNVAGQGVVNGLAPTFKDMPKKYGNTYPGAVIGGAPHAKLAPFGDIYFSFEFSTQLGYFLTTSRGVDVTSNSYGSSEVDNDGWDGASQEADVIHDGGSTTPVFSTGNGAPGFGTTSPPSPTAAIAVGASTQFGATGWDSIEKIAQVVDNDVVVWSNRGFGATGSPGVDVVADGAYSAGDATLNTVLDGSTAWATWGGTSRSTPVAAAATALAYQAYKKAKGSIPAGFYRTVKEILKSSAQDLGYDTTIQGAGSVDAGEAVETAAGKRASVSPSEWRAGDYRGTEYPVFTSVMAPGGSDEQQFTLSKRGGWKVSDRQMVRTDSESFSISSKNLTNESVYNFNAPDYLVDLSERVKRHKDADLMVVRLNYPRNQFDADGDYTEDQAWRLLTYNWTDANHDHNLWTDNDHDGVVDHVNKTTSSNPDGNLDLDFSQSEMDQGEYVRFMYHRAGSNALQSFVRDPKERMDDGLFLGLQHSGRNPAIPVTNFQVQIDWYENEDWAWVTTPKHADGSFSASIEVPEGTPYGMYSGAIELRDGKRTMVVPVAVAVAATAAQDAGGKLTGALKFGGAQVANAQSNLLYNNGSVFGASDWGWRPESGDWRFYFLDVPREPPEGSLFLANTKWQGTAPHTDIDTLIMGRSQNEFQLLDPVVFGAPYILDTVGKSPNTNAGAGVWLFDTATGGAADFVTAPAQEGLHAVALHQVGWQGDAFHTPVETSLGSASVDPTSVEVETAADSGSFDVSFESSVDLDGLTAEAFGLSQPSVTDETAHQDDANDPSSASIKKDVTISHASRLRVATAMDTDDVDLFVVHDADNDGNFTNDEIIAASASGSSNEEVELIAPDDGDYQVWAQGFAVAGTPSLELTIDAIQGNDMTVSGIPSGAIPAGTPVTVHVDFTKSMAPGQDYFGELLLGPPSAPTALAVPIKVSRN